MTGNLGKLAEFLRKHRPHALCDDCLAELVPITNRRQVQRLTASLAKRGGFVRGAGRCVRGPHAWAAKKVIKAV